jgi:hypothetical protein
MIATAAGIANQLDALRPQQLAALLKAQGHLAGRHQPGNRHTGRGLAQPLSQL